MTPVDLDQYAKTRGFGSNLEKDLYAGSTGTISLLRTDRKSKELLDKYSC